MHFLQIGKRFVIGLCLCLAASVLDAAEETLYFTGKAGEVPDGWRWVVSRPEPGSGMSPEFQYEGHTPVRMISGEQRLLLRSENRPLPKEGRIRFSVHMRASRTNANVTIGIIADNYAVVSRKKALLTENYQKVTVELPVPGAITRAPVFRFTIDAAEGGNDLLVGKVECELLPSLETSGGTGGLLKNGEFRFGSSHFYRKLFVPSIYGIDPPLFKPERVILPSPYNLYSESLTYVPGKTYTGIVRMRRAKRGEPAESRIHLVPAHFKGSAIKKFRLEDDFQDYAVQGSLPASRYDQMALRVEVQAGEIEIARMQLMEGAQTEFPPKPEVEMGSVGNNSFDAGETAALTVKVYQNRKPESGKLTRTTRDLFGKIVGRDSFDVPAEKVSTLQLPVDSSRRGVFFSALGFGNSKAEVRYAVVKNLTGEAFPENGMAGHFNLFLDYDLRQYKRYMPIEPNYNRFFVPRVPEPWELLGKPEVQEMLRTTGLRNVVCLSWKHLEKFGFDTRLDNELTPELEARILAEIERFAKLSGACGFYGVELFNEPHLWRVREGQNKGISTMPPETVARLYRKAYPLIKKNAPHLKVFGPCTSNKVPDYNRKFLEAGGGEGIDVFSFHSYNDDPDRDHVAERNLELGRLVSEFKPGMQICNTEVYYGIRRHPQSNWDEEARRVYTKDSELEQAVAYAGMYANSVVSSTPFSAFFPEWITLGVPRTDEQYLLASGAALNAAIEFLGNSGREKIILPLDDSLRCFVFPQAAGGPVATLRSPGAEKGKFISMKLPPGVKAFDLFGNALTGDELQIGDEVVYLRFAAGSDAAKMIEKGSFAGLSTPFEVTLSALNHQTLAVKLRNRNVQPKELTVSLERCPENWLPRKKSITLSLASFEEKTVPIPMEKFSLNASQLQSVLLKITSGSYQNEFLRELNAFPVRYAKDFQFRPEDYVFYGENNLSPFFNKLANQGKGDCSAKVAALWNETGLALSVEVTDDEAVFPEDVATAHLADSLQIYFDMRTAVSTRSLRNRSDDLVYAIGLLNGKTPFAWLEFAEGTRYIGEANRTTGLDDAVKVSVKREGKVTAYRVFFPVETLYKVNFVPGSVFGFSMLVNDNDGNGRKQGITLTPPGTEPHGAPHLFKDMILLSR